jgi:hypothetical protein
MQMPWKVVITIVMLAMTLAEGCRKANKLPGQMLDRSVIERESGSRTSIGHLQAVLGGSGRGKAPRFALQELSVSAAESQRFVGTKHWLELIENESDLLAAWQAVIEYCRTITCEVSSSNITNKTEQVLPSGHIAIRGRADQLKQQLAFVESRGRVAAHSTESARGGGGEVTAEMSRREINPLSDYRFFGTSV